ncbi:hypothetical protein V8C86DRAFT_2482604 [Haematococcus lacustris]
MRASSPEATSTSDCAPESCPTCGFSFCRGGNSCRIPLMDLPAHNVTNMAWRVRQQQANLRRASWIFQGFLGAASFTCGVPGSLTCSEPSSSNGPATAPAQATCMLGTRLSSPASLSLGPVEGLPPSTGSAPLFLIDIGPETEEVPEPVTGRRRQMPFSECGISATPQSLPVRSSICISSSNVQHWSSADERALQHLLRGGHAQLRPHPDVLAEIATGLDCLSLGENCASDALGIPWLPQQPQSIHEAVRSSAQNTGLHQQLSHAAATHSAAPLQDDSSDWQSEQSGGWRARAAQANAHLDSEESNTLGLTQVPPARGGTFQWL